MKGQSVGRLCELEYEKMPSSVTILLEPYLLQWT